MKKIILAICLFTFTLQSCKQTNTKGVTHNKNEALHKVFEQYYQERLALNPIEATFAGETKFNNLFPNTLSDDYLAKNKAFFEKYKKAMTQFDTAKLSGSDQLSKSILEWECNITLEGFQFREELMPINQFQSVPLMMGQLASGSSAQPFKTVKDYNNWLQRLNGFNDWIISAEARMKEGVALGYVLPEALTLRVIPQIKDLANADLKSNLFYSPLRQFPATFSDADKKKLTDDYSKMIVEKLLPSLTSLHHYISSDYLTASRKSTGINGITDGDKYYNYLIRKYTTTDLTADEIHQIGLKEVARILAEMEKVKTQVGFEGDIKAFFNHVRDRKELMPFTDPQQVIDNFNAIYIKMQRHLDQLFDLKPKTAFEVKQTEKFREASASAEYNQGSIDGTRPGVFYVPIPDVTKYNVYADEDLFLHEAIPGHHYQISLQQEDTSLPSFRKTIWFTAYGEGWALYTESLGKELGLYQDPYQYFGMLSSEMLRAVRLVVDTGMHTKGWTREQAIQYSLDNEAEPLQSIIAEIERYMAIPGQAVSYKIGQLKIRELRSKAEKQMAQKFDIKEFHNQVLETGCVPLKILEEKIDLWIKNKK
ncbi:DUF885 domain-containing protein [Flavobacterium tegetincola]|uniref:DUF885 domain-containing protein n=1 Tax=Flavobacterium tegetincola TaxID=150172 RepID=UPI0003FB8A75|nr:DUF885 domain-containing protein [Flavobacterium tegetincola]